MAMRLRPLEMLADHALLLDLIVGSFNSIILTAKMI
jgi:hypothetical protein